MQYNYEATFGLVLPKSRLPQYQCSWLCPRQIEGFPRGLTMLDLAANVKVPSLKRAYADLLDDFSSV